MRSNKAAVLFLILTILLSISLYGEGEGAHHFDWTGFFGKLINSLILFGILIYFLRKPLIDFLSKRSVGIRDEIVIRESNLKDQKTSLLRLESRLETIEKEVAAMLEEARKSGEAEAERIGKLAVAETERIVKNAADEIRARVDSSVLELKKRIADMTIEEFRNNYRDILTSELHKKIIEKNIEISGEIIEKG
jgi:F-type H+-transporting ATPase subunit b